VRYGRPVLMNYRSAMASRAGIMEQTFLQELMALLCALIFLTGGVTTLLGNQVGRILLLCGATTLLLYRLFIIVRGGVANMSPYQIDDFGPVFLFLLFACIVLLRGGLSPRSTG